MYWLKTLIFLGNWGKIIIIAFKILRIQVQQEQVLGIEWDSSVSLGESWERNTQLTCPEKTLLHQSILLQLCKKSCSIDMPLPNITPPEMIMSHNVFITVITARSRTWFYKQVSSNKCCKENILWHVHFRGYYAAGHFSCNFCANKLTRQVARN